MKHARKSPMFWVALAFICGIILSAFCPVPGPWFLVVAILALLATTLIALRVGSSRSGVFFFYLIQIIVGLSGWQLGTTSKVINATDPAWHLGEEVAMEGFVAEELRPSRSGYRTVFVCESPYQGEVMLYIPAKGTPPRINDRLKVKVHLHQHPEGFAGYSNWLHHQGIHASAKASHFQVIGHNSGLFALVSGLREKISNRFASLFHDPAMGGLCRAMLLGDRSGLVSEIRTSFSATGLSHIVAISGMNFAIIYVVLGFLLKPMLLLRHGRRLRAILIVSILAFFALLTGANPAVVRAAIMLSLLEIGQSFWQRTNSINALSISALIFLALDPQALFAPDFQLSYAAVLGILLLERPILAYMRLRMPRFPRTIAAAISVTLAAQAATTPLVAWHFHSFPTYFLFANLIVLPVVTIIVQLGFAGFLLAWIPGVAECWAGCLDFLLWLVTTAADLLAQLPGATITALESGQMGIWILLSQAAAFSLAIEFRQIARVWKWVTNPAVATPIPIDWQNFRIRALSVPAVMVWVLLGFLF